MDINLTLYDNDGTTALGFVQVYDFNLGGPAKDSITADGLAPGTYYIQVQSRNSGDFENYTISDRLFTPPLVNDIEPNGTRSNCNCLTA